jgi:DNA-binding response OmpR family regulator
MTTRILIVDPDIAFTVPIKQALEQSGDLSVSVFANGQAALESAQRTGYDVAILDFNVADIPLPNLIHELRQIQAGLFVLVSPRKAEHVAMLPQLDVQGSVTKPYFARQLIPVMREALSAKARLAQKELERRLDAAEGSTAADTTPRIVEPAVQPDDTFNRLVQQDTGKVLPVPPSDNVMAEAAIPENATIADLVSGQSASVAQPESPESLPEEEQVEAVPEAPAEPTPDLAAAALGAAEDDTVPLDLVALEALVKRTDQMFGAPTQLPPWARETPADADQPTLVEPAVTHEDTQPSSHIGIRWFVSPEGETEPGGGIVQQRLEADRQLPEPPPIPDPYPEPTVPPMLEEPSFVAKVVEEVPPEFSRSTVTIPELANATEPAPTPVNEASTLPAPEVPDSAAKLAVQLTQLSVESTAQITVLTRDGELLASAGQMPPTGVAGVVVTINQAWQGATDEGNALVRFINVPVAGDFLMYSIRTVESMTLSMLFPSETPLRVIRQQAKQLLKALESIPEPAPGAPSESQAATTLPSRPTDLRPPEGMPEAARSTEGIVEEAAAAETPTPPRAEGLYTAYAFVWLPREAVIADGVANMLVDWINAVAAAHAWQLDGTEIQPAYVTVQISIGANEMPSAAVETLMRETAARANDPALWSEAYYIVAPGRAVTQQEIANFMEYRRDAQDAA